MKHLFVIAAFLFTVGLPAQENDRAPLASRQGTSSIRTTRAVVVGISDYQDPAIPDLRFAHRDAEAFAQWLGSFSGGSLKPDQMKVLINKDATAGGMVSAFDWLMTESNPGDRAIIYFAGHCDVELNTAYQPGFLLPWDSPPKAYMAGAYPVFYLQAVATNLAQEKNVEVLIVLDAFRAGKLAGQAIDGTRLTGINLAKPFSSEIKILACQPHEYSIESEQWGGGHSAFSYHLINGLYGLADRDGDEMVSIKEINYYLEDRVITETAPQSQVPLVLGTKNFFLSRADTSGIRTAQIGDLQAESFMAVVDQGLEDAVLSHADSAGREQYRLFSKSLALGNFFNEESGADTLYQQLIRNPAFEPISDNMTRNYAAALQDDAQQVLNDLLRMDYSELNLSRKAKLDKYRAYPRYLERAADLLGKHHYMYATLKARQYFFEGYVLSLSNRNPNVMHGERTMERFHKVLEIEPQSPHAWWMMSKVAAYNLSQPDSAWRYALQAQAYAPTWILPLTDLAPLLAERFEQYDKAEELLLRAARIDSGSLVVMKKLGIVYMAQKKYAEAEELFLRIVKNSPESVHIPMIYNNLGALYRETGRMTKARRVLLAAIDQDSTQSNPHYNLGLLYEASRQPGPAEAAYRKVVDLDPAYRNAYLRLIDLQAATGRFPEALAYLERALQNGCLDAGTLATDPLFGPLRILPEWIILMDRYFPDRIRN